jgi:hypothetical protein
MFSLISSPYTGGKHTEPIKWINRGKFLGWEWGRWGHFPKDFTLARHAFYVRYGGLGGGGGGREGS